MFIRLLQVILCLSSFSLAYFANASDDITKLSEHFSLRGFGTLGVVSSGDDELGFQRDWSRGNSAVYNKDWSFEQDSLLGVQLNAQITEKLQGAIQLVGRDRIDNSLENSLEWAYLSYDLLTNTTVRAGRMGVDLFMLSEYRNVDFSYLWARPPIEYYGLIAFDHFDGIDLTHVTPMWGGQLHFKAFAGASNDNNMDSYSVYLDPFYGVNVFWENNNWLLRLSYGVAEMDNSNSDIQTLQSYVLANSAYWPAAESVSDDLQISGQKTFYYATGMAYDNAPWQIQSELSYTDSEYGFFKPIISGYLSVAHQFDPVTLYSIISATKTTKDYDVDWGLIEGTVLQQVIEEIEATNTFDQKTLSFGARWDIRYNLALKLQWDHHWIKHGGTLWSSETATIEDKTLDTFSINLNFTF